eukprot:CAMPEP_0206177032 /NCGR_PEP_ID=MMETSP1474-20131121/59952_1 /ASSEMBLY_ACC=CAM_ASM_001110 /TAXON_ID=97495 /ORGANISM="Imantonia sp., Strain RCC918" /LENGTH=114 /DNA_ID=CAMNT_0053588521 /DNA_START=20 /DNA_END=364 /DNA_ORIENTATION=-
MSEGVESPSPVEVDACSTNPTVSAVDDSAIAADEVMTADVVTPEVQEEHEPLSWKVVSIIYAGGVFLCLLFAALHALKVDTVKGFWIIFAPFLPCLAYSLHRWRLQVQEKAKVD